ncbi:MAG: hypothetical protein Tsb0016_13310 [Sphingomonadales bacterium]
MTKVWFRDLADQDAATVLVVDDLEVNRAVLTRRLAKQGYQIVEACDGREALARVKDRVPDIILLDMMMPDMSGLQVVEILRTDFSPSVLPIIMVTARSETEVMVEALEAGANDYIQKPVNFPVLLARMVTQIARQRAEQQLRSSHDALDSRVAERTLELHDLKGQLRSQQAQESEMQWQLSQLANEIESLTQAHEGLRRHLTTAIAPLTAEIAQLTANAGGDEVWRRAHALASRLQTSLMALAGDDGAIADQSQAVVATARAQLGL